MIAGRAVAGSVAAAEQRAHRVGLDGVEEALDLGLDKLADAVLGAGDAGGLAEPLQ